MSESERGVAGFGLPRSGYVTRRCETLTFENGEDEARWGGGDNFGWCSPVVAGNAERGLSEDGR